jgi:hypothetical protein
MSVLGEAYEETLAELRASLTATLAALERVRALALGPSTMVATNAILVALAVQPEQIRQAMQDGFRDLRALAGQPEAPQCHAYVTGNPIDCGGCEEHVGQREATTLEANASLPPKRPLEAPKGQEADPIEAAHAFVSGSLERDLAAANARIEYLTAERIAERRLLSNELHRESIRLTAANARADAAERGNEEGTKQLTAMTAERDQLAARVRELEEAARVIQWEEW